jgi:hypothetical protein
MSSSRLFTSSIRLAASGCALTLVLSNAPTAWAQASSGLFDLVDILSFSPDRRVPVRRVALSGNTAVVFPGGPNEVFVFERDPSGNDWLLTTTLAPVDGTAGFGRGATTDGRTIVVAAEGANFVFERAADGQWQDVAKLAGGTAHIGRPTTIFVTSVGAVFVFERTDDGWQHVATLTGDTNADRFGTAGFAVSGSTAFVGAPGTPGLVYVFEPHNGDAWGEVARLTSPSPPADAADVFGTSVAIGGDNAIVAGEAGAFIFSRDHGGPDAWGQVAALSPGLETRCAGSVRTGPVPSGSPVSIERITAALLSVCLDAPFTSFLRIFERNEGGANAWGGVALVELPLGAGSWQSVTISGKLMLVARGTSTIPNTHTLILARHEGARNGWGEVARFAAGGPPFGEVFTVGARAISGDTVFLGALFSDILVPATIAVYVADTDRDGLRDGIDPCPRDPLNRTDKQCRRDTSSLPTVDHLITSSEFTTTFVRPRRAVITATFTNIGSVAIRNPFFAVTEITDGAVLRNGDGLDRGVGATLSPDVGDGILSPGESTFVRFRVRLPRPGPLTFGVAVHGDEAP